MVKLPPNPNNYLSKDAFNKIYDSIKKHWKKDTCTTELHRRLASIIAFAPIDIINKEMGASHGDNTTLIKRFKNNIKTLIATLEKAEELYPTLSDPETETHLSTKPDWLEPHTDAFDIDNLKAHLAGLEQLHTFALDHSENGTKKPRYSGRLHYIKALINVFENFTDLKAEAKRNDSTPFSDFAVSFFYYSSIKVKNKKKMTDYILYEEMKKIRKK